jgi:intracellular septation protein
MKRRIALNLVVEFGPLLAFFVLAEPLGFIPAAGVFVAATVLAMITDAAVHRRVAVFPLVVMLFVVGFGGATLLSGNPAYLELNYSFYPVVFGLAALADITLFDNRLFRWMFGSIFAITERGWFLTTRNWVFVFAMMAASNEFARRYLEPEQWVLFRIGVTALVLAFSAYQFTIARRERLPEATSWGLRAL